MSSSEVLRDLAFAKVAFQLRTIEALLTASADTHPKDGDVKQAPLVSGAAPQAGDAQTASQDPSHDR